MHLLEKLLSIQWQMTLRGIGGWDTVKSRNQLYTLNDEVWSDGIGFGRCREEIKKRSVKKYTEIGTQLGWESANMNFVHYPRGLRFEPGKIREKLNQDHGLWPQRRLLATWRWQTLHLRDVMCKTGVSQNSYQPAYETQGEVHLKYHYEISLFAS